MKTFFEKGKLTILSRVSLHLLDNTTAGGHKWEKKLTRPLDVI